MEKMIEAHNLHKVFDTKIAVKDVSFSINEGEIFGFLGHNGAGKTTTIRMLTGQIHPTQGYATIAGLNSATEQNLIKPFIGVVSDTQNLYERMTGYENLKLFADLFEVKKTRVSEVLDLVQLKSRSKDKVETYSNGMRQRLLIARALLHEPDIIFLDEPSRGLDPTSAKDIRQAIKDLAHSGVTIFLTTHNMEEAEDLCNRIAFIKKGEIKALDTPEKLKIEHGNPSVLVIFEDGEKATFPLSNSNAKDMIGFLSRFGNKQIKKIHSQEASLEDVFIKLVGLEAEQ